MLLTTFQTACAKNVKQVRPWQNYYEFHLPENLNQDQILRKAEISINDLEQKPEVLKDFIKYFISLIIKKRVNQIESKKIPDRPDSYTILNSAALQDVMANNYACIRKFLIKVGIIEIDNHYIPGMKSYGYRLTDKYRNSGIRKLDSSRRWLLK